MYNIFIYIAVSVITAILAVVITVIIQKRSARTQAKIIVDEARQEAEMLKQKKMLEVREEELQIKAEHKRKAGEG